MLSPRQFEMLKDCADGGGPTDFANYDAAGTLAWRNREQVISALIRKGLLDDDLKITDEGRKYLPPPVSNQGKKDND